MKRGCEDWFETWHGHQISAAAEEALEERAVVRELGARLESVLGDGGRLLEYEVAALDARVSYIEECHESMSSLAEAYAREESATVGLKAAIGTAEQAFKAAIAEAARQHRGPGVAKN